MSEILFYAAPDGSTQVQVQVETDTVWLTQRQMAELFAKDLRTISEHLGNLYREGELERAATIRKFRIVRLEGKRQVERDVEHYNLDVIISVGYRVKSAQGTQFRIWATRILREHLLQGYTLNQQRLRQSEQQREELHSALRLLRRLTTEEAGVGADQAAGLLRVLTDYAYALEVLDRYDHQQLQLTGTTPEAVYELHYEEARRLVQELGQRTQAGGLFGREKDDSFRSSLAAVYQTAGGEEVYPSVEEKAAHLLYFVTKNHSFSDGNKRIAAFLFVYFLDRNQCLYRRDGSRRLADNALVALTLMIAESRPEEKDTMVRVIVNLINQQN
ncbi:virulence protein RhuM/Fic/DOC family protein [Hymenobacter crusticola]|uniref:Cytochrome C biogenesis protein CycH n=1 Tax=Hymenobacter crusticola TaxID=1770526 RepID=A0A2C9ZVI7_9BACT|nr:virulence protein RhuM/Fic/DOC family protein [Hymenobacter crusticola]OUJ70447.1 cytochrome C biogenesis protein CycH [Hymenobacter crusticola]